MQLEDIDSEAVNYVMLRAMNRFYAEFGRYPGCYNDSSETDVVKLKVKIIESIKFGDLFITFLC